MSIPYFPIEKAVIIKKLLDENDIKDNSIISMSQILGIIIEKGYGNIGFHSGLDENGNLLYDPV